ncbi:MAG: hypothetical protein K0R21_2064 [Anaerocolumna sp.]|jgi:hypothetical protein|nr:hypothetical protein [Anaerocolumna sp.]
MINLHANIEPWKGLGGIRLYAHISEYQELLESSRAKTHMLGRFLIRYEIENQVFMWFNIVNGKLFKITACKQYKGKLFDKITIGMEMEQVLKIDNSFMYNDFEEVYESSKGVYIETNPEDDRVMWISVFIKEINEKSFEIGNW